MQSRERRSSELLKSTNIILPQYVGSIPCCRRMIQSRSEHQEFAFSSQSSTCKRRTVAFGPENDRGSHCGGGIRCLIPRTAHDNCTQCCHRHIYPAGAVFPAIHVLILRVPLVHAELRVFSVTEVTLSQTDTRPR